VGDVQSRDREFEDALLGLDRVAARELLHACAREQGALGAAEALVVPALQRIGQGWEEGRLALAQVYMAGRICEELFAPLLPETPPDGTGRCPKVALAVVEDRHMLGRRMVLAALRAAGFAVADWGSADLPELLRRVETERPDILLLSALMLPSALRVRELRARLDARGLKVRLVVGGAPFNFDPDLWREVGADAMGRSATDAIRIVRELTEPTP